MVDVFDKLKPLGFELAERGNKAFEDYDNPKYSPQLRCEGLGGGLGTWLEKSILPFLETYYGLPEIDERNLPVKKNGKPYGPTEYRVHRACEAANENSYIKGVLHDLRQFRNKSLHEIEEQAEFIQSQALKVRDWLLREYSPIGATPKPKPTPSGPLPPEPSKPRPQRPTPPPDVPPSVHPRSEPRRPRFRPTFIFTLVLAIAAIGVAYVSSVPDPQPTKVHKSPASEISAGEFFYGSTVFGHWISGGRLERQGDFDAAITEYTNALAASKTINTSPNDPKRNELMRACATSGSQARLDGASAGKKALDGHGRNPHSIAEANIMSHAAFRTTSNLNSTKHPELASGCP